MFTACSDSLTEPDAAVAKAPSITKQPLSAVINAGDAFSISVEASGNPSPEFRWFKNGQQITGAYSPAITIASATIDDAGSYVAIAENSHGSETSEAATISVISPPVFTSYPTSRSVSESDSLIFHVTANGYPLPSYQWKKNGEIIPGAVGAYFIIASLSITDSGTYTAEASNIRGTVSTPSFVLTVIPLAKPSILSQPASISVPEGESAEFHVSIIGNPYPYLQWQKNGEPVPGANDTIFRIESVQTNDAGIYSVSVTNNVGGTESNNAELTVLTPPKITANPEHRMVSVGKNATLTFSAGGVPLPTFKWQKNGIDISNATGIVYQINTASLEDSGAYRVIATNAIGSDTSEVAMVTVFNHLLFERNGSMIKLPSAQFKMGQMGIAEPVRTIDVSSFFIDTTEVTQLDFSTLMGFNPSSFQQSDLPVERVSWFDAALYCNERSKRDLFDTVYSYSSKFSSGNRCTLLVNVTTRFTANGYRLPAEAEWEYACRAGTAGDYFWENSVHADQHAWFSSNSNLRTHSVALKLPNYFGLYDMAGNVWEWCNDFAGSYNASQTVNPTGSSEGTRRISRGGAWNYTLPNLRSATRSDYFPYYADYTGGFRTVRRP